MSWKFPVRTQNPEAPSVGEADGLDDLFSEVVRSAAIRDVEVSSNYNKRTIRRFRVDSKETVRYLMPLLTGAAIAALGIFGLVEILSKRDQIQPLSNTGMEVRRDVSPGLRFPSLEESRSVDRVR